MNMHSLILYHSNYLVIEFPAICKSKFTKYFLYAFYCTSKQKQPEIFGSKFIIRLVNVYTLNNIAYLNVRALSNYYNKWLEFVTSCSNGNIHTYDVVIGLIADNTTYDYMDSYI